MHPADHEEGLSMAAAARGKISVADLAALIAAGEIDTVVTAVCDMQGRLVGKRVTGQFFVKHCLGLTSAPICLALTWR